MRRRVVVAALLSPATAFAQPGKPTVGFLSNRTAEQGRPLVEAVRQGLKQKGFVEGENVAIEYRWSGGNLAALPALAQELVGRRVAVIVAGGTPQTAKAATSTIPVVFTTGLDPTVYGLVKTLARPGGNLTGATFYSGALIAKQLELLRELAPRSRSFGLLVKGDSPTAEPQIDEARLAGTALGQTIEAVTVTDEASFERALSAFAQRSNPALIVSVDPYFDSHAAQLVALINRLALPAVYNLRQFVEVGGLMSYGASILDAYRQAGSYTGRILKGAAPGDLPVLLPTRFEMLINRRAAAALGLSPSPALLARTDEITD